ncbi:MAG TPA: hypothetical protein VIT65_16810 [Microlunatus sp.]
MQDEPKKSGATLAMGSARRLARSGRPPGRAAGGWGDPSAAGICIVRVEAQGPAGLLITVTRYPNVAGASADGTIRRTVDIEKAVGEVRSFLSEFCPSG